MPNGGASDEGTDEEGDEDGHGSDTGSGTSSSIWSRHRTCLEQKVLSEGKLECFYGEHSFI